MDVRTYNSVEAVLDDVWSAVDFMGFDQRPEINAVGIFGNTPIKIAITCGNLQAVQLLVDHGANVNAIIERGDTPLHHAISMGHFHLARYLVSKGANQSIRNVDGKLPRDLCWEGEWEGIFGAKSA
jgi:ankyrin repeat protein